MAFGERYGIDYRFPQLLQKPEPPHASPVLRGEVEEMTLPCGMCVTHSDVHVLQPYETTSRHSSPLYMLVVLEGCVALTLNGEQHGAFGMAFTSRLSEHQAMRARHDADSRLRTLSLGLYPDGTARWPARFIDARVGKVPDANAYLADTGFSAERIAVRAAERAESRVPTADAGRAYPAAVRSWAERLSG